MIDEHPGVVITFEGQSKPATLKASLWDWIKYYAFNIYRKPMVWRRQRELVEIFNVVKWKIEKEVLPHLWDNRFKCQDCTNQYMALKPQVFLSQIEAILKQMKCTDHKEISEKFLILNSSYFTRSEEISRWINGF